MEMEREWKEKGNYFKRHFIGESLKYGWMEHSEPDSFTSWDLSPFALRFSIPNFSITTHMIGFTLPHLIRGHCKHEGKGKRTVQMLRRDRRTMQRKHTSFPSEKEESMRSIIHPHIGPSLPYSMPSTGKNEEQGVVQRMKVKYGSGVWFLDRTPGLTNKGPYEFKQII